MSVDAYEKFHRKAAMLAKGRKAGDVFWMNRNAVPGSARASVTIRRRQRFIVEELDRDPYYGSVRAINLFRAGSTP